MEGRAEDALLVTEVYGNEKNNAFVRSIFPADAVLRPAECTPERVMGRPLAVLGAPLALTAGPRSESPDITEIASDPTAAFPPPDYKVIHADVKEKAEVTDQYIPDALNGKFEAPHDRKIYTNI